MKKFRISNILFPVVAICSVLLALSSCTNISSNESESGSGSVAFALSPEVFRAALRESKFGDTGGVLKYENAEWILEELKNVSYKLVVSVKGGYSASAERSWTYADFIQEIDVSSLDSEEGQEKIFDNIARTLSNNSRFEFSGIPVGKTVYAECKLYENRLFDGESDSTVVLHGRSSEITIKGGENTLPLAIFEAYAEFPFEITLEFDEGTDVASVLSNYPDFKLYPFATDSSFVSSLYSATDDYALYEAAINCYQSEEDIDSLTPISIEQDNYSISGTTLTVTDTTELPVSIANKNKGEEVSIVPIVWFWGTGSLQSKYVGLYTTSEAKPAITPSKSETNKLSIKMKKLDVVDTTTILYSKSGSNYDFKFDNQNYTGSTNSFCFDNDGNFYYLNLIDSNWYIQSSNYKCSSVKATVTYSGEGTVDVTSGMCSSPVIFVDRKTNILYMAISNGGTYINVVKYPDLISSGATTNSVAYGFSIPDSTYMLNPGQPMTIYNGVVYAVAIRSGYPNKVIKVDLSNTTDVSEIDLSDVSSILTSSVSITDMIYQDGAVYMLVKQQSLPSYARGGVIRYDVSTGAVKIIGWTNNPIPFYESNPTYYYAYNNGGNQYRTAGGSSYESADKVIIRSDAINNDGSKFLQLYSPASASAGFYGAVKFIAIKPKKLVIADDGVAFYTDSLGAYRLKNVNRVVTVDLKAFALSTSEVDSTVNFDGDYSNGSNFVAPGGSLYGNGGEMSFYNATTKEVISTCMYFSSDLENPGETTISNNANIGVKPGIPTIAE